MKILYFTRDYTTHDHRFLAALAKTEHQVYYLRLERRGHQLEDRPLPPEIEIVPWAGGQDPARFRDGLRLLKDLRRVIRSVQPDLVHAGPLQTSALLAALAGFHPLVSMSWGYDLLIDAGRSPFWRWATAYTLTHSDVMVGDCKTIRQRAVSFGMADERIITFPWGIDLHHFSPEERPQNPNCSRPPEDSRLQGHSGVPLAARGRRSGETFTLLSTRGWEPIYGVEIIARAFVKASQKISAAQTISAAQKISTAQEAGARGLPQLRLTMLGNGSLAARLRQIFLQGGVLDQVSFPGQVSYDDLPRYYRSADLYLSASHSDGTSISLLEAMACGVPALVSDIPGNREWITPGEQGWWFRDGDVEALTGAILETVEQRARLPELRRAARCTTEQRADWERNFPQLLYAYDLAMRNK